MQTKKKHKVKSWSETTQEGENYLECNGYSNAKRIGESDYYECDKIGLPLRDVEVLY